jgi:hypothetical protein
VDWANIGTLRIGNATRKLSLFVMVLSYSRMLYVESTLSQCLEDFMLCHTNAFRFFGGVPKKINYDNLKTVVLSRVGSQIKFHPKFLDFAGYYLFEPIPCGIRKAHEKGKVEHSIKYIRSSFLAGRTIASWTLLQQEIDDWRDHEANQRIHGTTKEKPMQRLEQERPLLQKLPSKDYDASIIRSVQVTTQALVYFEANRYSVPFAYSGKTLTLKATTHQVKLFDQTKLLACHPRCWEKYQVIEDLTHYEGLLKERKKARLSKLTQNFLALDSQCALYLEGLMASELHVVKHLEKIEELTHCYGKKEVIKAIDHAMRFKAFGAHYIQTIITQQRASRNLALPQNLVLIKKPQWTKVSVEETDLSLYDDLFEGNG